MTSGWNHCVFRNKYKSFPDWKLKRDHHVAPQKDQEDQSEQQHVAVRVLQLQWPAVFAVVTLAGLGDGAGRRIRPKRFVIRAAIVVARKSEERGERQD